MSNEIVHRPPPKLYTLNDYDRFIVQGHQVSLLQDLPDVEEVDPLEFLNNMASLGHSWHPRWGYTKVNGGSATWSQCFITSGINMSSSPSGSGYAVRYRQDKYERQPDGGYISIKQPQVLRFHLCRHQFVEGPGANHSRGWHPGWCGKCGVDMSIDSGD